MAAPAAPSALPSESAEYFHSYGDIDIHRLMLRDTQRCDRYRQALQAACRARLGACVLDVGCGSGLLACYAAQAGARLVVGVEGNPKMAAIAREMVARNAFADRVVVLDGPVEALLAGVARATCAADEEAAAATGAPDLPVDDARSPRGGVRAAAAGSLTTAAAVLPAGGFDVIVSEWMGFYLVHEAMLNSVLWARDRFLARVSRTTEEGEAAAQSLERLLRTGSSGLAPSPRDFYCQSERAEPGCFSGLLLPSSCRIFGAPCETQTALELAKLRDFDGLSVSPALLDACAAELMATPGPLCDGPANPAHLLCVGAPGCGGETEGSRPQLIHTLDLLTLGAPDSGGQCPDLDELDSGAFSFRVARAGLLSGFCIWFDCSFHRLRADEEKAEEIVLDTSPFVDATHWYQTVVPLGEGCAVQAGEELMFRMAMHRRGRQYSIDLQC